MSSKKPTDEILAALAEVGLRLVNLGEHRGAASARWVCQLGRPFEAKDDTYETWAGWGPTPADALIAALKEAGVDVSDE